MEKEKKITAYKGFDQDLKCRGFQYEVGKEYEMDGDIKCCERGFHDCESPLEVLAHYFFLSNGKMARFCEVEQSGNIDKENNTTKIGQAVTVHRLGQAVTLHRLIALVMIPLSAVPDIIQPLKRRKVHGLHLPNGSTVKKKSVIYLYASRQNMSMANASRLTHGIS